MKKLFAFLMLAVGFCSFGVIAPNNNDVVANRVMAADYSQVQALHILVPTEQKAIEVRNEILKGTTKMEIFNNFRNAAKKYSTCPSASSGGILGWFGKGEMVPEFEKAAFALPAGQVSEPVKTQFGWHLIYVVSKK